MGLTQGDVIQLVDRQVYLGIDVLNVYYYRYFIVAPATDEAYQAIADWFIGNVIAGVCDIQTTLVTHMSLEIRNLTNAVDVHTYAVDEQGTITVAGGSASPSYLTAGFILRRESAVTRNGYKRYSGLSEAYIDGNDLVLNSTQRAFVEAVLAAEIPLGLLESLDPVIYREATLTDPAVTNGISSAQFVGLGTQNSRKR